MENDKLKDVSLKAVKNGIYCKYSRWAFGRDKFQKLQVGLIYDYGKYRLQPIHKSNFSLPLEEYKVTWWLKENKEE